MTNDTVPFNGTSDVTVGVTDATPVAAVAVTVKVAGGGTTTGAGAGVDPPPPQLMSPQSASPNTRLRSPAFSVNMMSSFRDMVESSNPIRGIEMKVIENEKSEQNQALYIFISIPRIY
jgi:hypothetical protein